MSDRNFWLISIQRNCRYYNGWVCSNPFSINYSAREYHVREGYVIHLDDEEYLEIAEMSPYSEEEGFLATLTKSIAEATKPRKRIRWSGIDSVDPE